MVEARDVPIVLAKVILSVSFIVFGANGFLHFLPLPPPESQSARSFLGVLMSTGYFSVVKALEILGGALVLSGRLAPLGLLILGPILVNIALYDLLMDPKGLPLVIVLGALALFIAFRHKEHFAPFLRPQREHCTFKGK